MSTNMNIKLNKVGHSIEESLTQNTETEIANRSGRVGINNQISISLLKRLSKSQDLSCLVSRASLEQKRLVDTASNVIKPGLYIEKDEPILVLPDSFFHIENKVLGGFIEDITKSIGLEVALLDNQPTNISTFYDDEFIQGLWLGFFTTTTQNRRRGKTGFELGRTCAYSLVVRSLFEDIPQLGISALVKDQYFFGNNPGEEMNKTRVPFLVKEKILSAFEDVSIGVAVYKAILKVSKSIAINMAEDEFNKMIADNIRPLSDVISDYYHSENVKIGKKVVKKTRKPNHLRSSPLYLKEEMDIFARYSSSVFSDLDSFNKNYIELIRTQGFKNVCSKIGEIVNQRWELLQRFASTTKKRLQDIRKVSKKPTLKKAEVSSEEVTAFLMTQTDVNSRLHSELVQVIGVENLKRSIQRKDKLTLSRDIDVDAYLYNVTFKMYKNIENDGFKTAYEKELEIPDAIQLTDDYEKAIKHFSDITKKLDTAISNSNGADRAPEHRLVNRSHQITNLQYNLETQLKRVEQLHNKSLEAALNYYFEGYYIDAETYLTQVRSELRRARTFFNETIRDRCKKGESNLSRLLIPSPDQSGDSSVRTSVPPNNAI
jgi:hypothetical protein